MVAFTVNGSVMDVIAEDNKPLLWVLREDLGVLGPKYGCGVAQCGACWVLIDGVSTPSCAIALGPCFPAPRRRAARPFHSRNTRISMSRWTIEDMPSQHGRSAIVTGTGGLGYEDALALSRAGASVVIAGRNAQKGASAVEAVRRAVPDAKVRFGELDLACLASIGRFADRITNEQTSLDLLINSAGVMTPPVRRVTRDGFELQFGTNHLGHFALTARLLPLLRRSRGARVVSLGSVAARSGTIDFDDLQAERRYKAMTVYSQSKLACIMFALELSRRSKAAGWSVESLAAHPGISRTDLIPNGAGRWSLAGVARSLLPFLFQPASHGALPTLYAATDPAAQDGLYYGPDKLGGTRGYPTEEKPPPRAMDIVVAARLWETSLRLTNVAFG